MTFVSALQHDRSEWSRSRYWLCHFLHNRHVRHRIAWGRPHSMSPREQSLARRWAIVLQREINDPDTELMRSAIAHRGNDPAYVQSIRLYVKEKQYHADLLARWRDRCGVADARVPTLSRLTKRRTALGLRFEHAMRWLEQIVTLSLLRVAERNLTDPALTRAVQELSRDTAAHLAMHTEWLTMAFAEFNFVRRNLRRHRLRVLFGWTLMRVVLHHGDLIAAAGVTRRAFIRDNLKQFESLLEQVVPYRRDALIALLLAQQNHPFARSSWLNG